MKKSIILLSALAALGLASCEDTSDLGVQQKNEAPSIIVADGYVLQNIYSTSETNAVNLDKYLNAMVPVVNIALTTEFPEDATVIGEMEIGNDADFTKSKVIALTSEPAEPNPTLQANFDGPTRCLTGYVEANEWDKVFVDFYGLNPAERENYARFRLWIKDGDQLTVMYYDKATSTQWTPSMAFDVTPVDVRFDVAASYNLVYKVAGQEYTVPMYHNPENHQYDDPNFNCFVNLSEDELAAGPLEWTIVNGDDPSKVYGVAKGYAADVTTGFLDPMTDGGSWGVINVAGSYKIDVNMLAKSFKVLVAPESLYVVSLSYITFDKAAQLATEDYISYTGMAGIESGWGLTGQAAYKPTLYSNNADQELSTDEKGFVTGGLTYDTSGAPLNDGSAIPLAGARGLFYVKADLQALTYTLYRCGSMGITGQMTNWGNPDEVTGEKMPDIPLYGLNANGNISTTATGGSRTTYYMEWGGTLEVEAGQEWKIRANSAWEVSFGPTSDDGSYATDGTPVEIKFNAGNFVAPESGKYTIKVYLKRTYQDGAMTPYQMTVEKVD